MVHRYGFCIYTPSLVEDNLYREEKVDFNDKEEEKRNNEGGDATVNCSNVYCKMTRLGEDNDPDEELVC